MDINKKLARKMAKKRRIEVAKSLVSDADARNPMSVGTGPGRGNIVVFSGPDGESFATIEDSKPQTLKTINGVPLMGHERLD